MSLWSSAALRRGSAHLVAAAAAVMVTTTTAEPTAIDPTVEIVPGTHFRREAGPAKRVHAAMTLPQRVGQLFMVGTPATQADPATRGQIGRYHVGNVMLTGRSYGGTATPARVAAAMQALTSRTATAGAGLLVATDQEGGAVQVLRGPGISEIPSALEQGGWSAPQLREAAGRWARQLRAAGVNMNLAPVLDTVPSPAAAPGNAPIGFYGRQYGYSVRQVTRKGGAFARGMAAEGVVPVVKHFPGLGRVRANTDTSAGVTDQLTGRDDDYLRPFRAAITDGVRFVMMSSALYPRLDARNPAVFSPTVIGDVLRRDLDFDGVVISDDLGAAAQVARWPAGARATKFIGAGGDMVLTVSPAPLPDMYDAVLTRARSRPAFRAKVNQAALRVLEVKQSERLLAR